MFIKTVFIAFVECLTFVFADAFPAKDKVARGIKRTRDDNEVVQNPQSVTDTYSPTATRSSYLNGSTDSQRQGRFLIQVSFEKLRRVEDPESSLRRSVLINNTLKLVHREIYGVKSPFGLTSAMTMNVDSHVTGNNSPLNLQPPRKRTRHFFNEVNMNCSCRRKANDGEEITSQEKNCERCTLAQVLNEDLEDDVFQNDNIHLEKESSIFSELDSVFHSFVCALET